MYLMKVIAETNRAHEIWYLCLYFVSIVFEPIDHLKLKERQKLFS